MACYRPIPARRERPGILPAVRLWPELGTADLELPCGKCIGCRTSYATQWANRIMTEAQLHRHNIAVTLTYDDEHLPNGGLNGSHLQSFIKRLRQLATRKKTRTLVARDPATNIRFFACGEYGELYERPHYHCLIFNAAFPDAKQVGKDLFSSATLNRLWLHGDHKIGYLTGETANYVARYTVRKQNQLPCDRDGVERTPPFVRMSLRPAIGLDWLKRYAGDLRNGFFVDRDGVQTRIPRYYAKKLRELDWQAAEQSEANSDAHLKRSDPAARTDARRKDAEIIHKRRAELGHQPKF